MKCDIRLEPNVVSGNDVLTVTGLKQILWHHASVLPCGF